MVSLSLPAALCNNTITATSSPPAPTSRFVVVFHEKEKKTSFFPQMSAFFSNKYTTNSVHRKQPGFMCKTALFCHCLHADWDRDQPSLPFKSHKTINLTSTDHPILLGSADANSVSSSLDFTSRSPKEALPTPAHQLIVSDPESLKRTESFD